MDKIILLGCGGHAKSVVDSIEKLGNYEVVGFLDKQAKVKYENEITYKNYRIIGTDALVVELYRSGIHNAFITLGYMGNSEVRNQLCSMLKKIGYRLPTIIDETAVVAEDAKIGAGVFVGKRAVVNSNASIGEMCIINTGAIIEHECTIGAFSHVAVGTVVCGKVKIGTNTFVGANATVIQEVVVGNNVIVGAGSIVTKEIGNNMKYYEKREKIYE